MALLAERADWGTRRLARALRRAGAEPVRAALADCGLRARGGHGPAVRIPGFADALPHAVLVRAVGEGSFEQVTLRLGVLHALSDLGVPVHNDARAIERCVDKSATSVLLAAAGVPSPPTWTTGSHEEARALVAAEATPARPLVLKPLFGAEGRGLRLVERSDDLPPPEDVAGVYHLQAYVSDPGGGWRDWRVLVVGERAVAAMIRHGISWRTNVAQGGRGEGVAPAGPLAAIAVAAARAVGASHAGVDLVRDADGRAQVLEVNSMPAWSALQRVSDADIAQAIADHLLARLGRPASVVLGCRP